MEVILQAKDVPPDLLEYFEPAEYQDTKSVFVVNPGSYAGAHFATFPPALVRPMILAGTSERGCCPKCQAPYERVIERTGHQNKREPAHAPNNCPTKTDSTGWAPTTMATDNWHPTCSCNAGPPIPCTVLDPFGGAGTTGAVARQLGRRWQLIELSQAYCDDHIIPRLSEPLTEWAQQREPEPEPEAVQLGLDL